MEQIISYTEYVLVQEYRFTDEDEPSANHNYKKDTCVIVEYYDTAYFEHYWIYLN